MPIAYLLALAITFEIPRLKMSIQAYNLALLLYVVDSIILPLRKHISIPNRGEKTRFDKTKLLRVPTNRTLEKKQWLEILNRSF